MNWARLVSILFLCGYLLNGCGGGGASVHTTPLTITSQALPNGITHTMYAGSPSGFSLTASGGTAPYHWSWAAANGSSLPPGLNLSNAAISGTPSATGSFTVIVTLTDSASPVAQQTANYPIEIVLPLRFSNSPAPPAGAVNAPYSGFTFAATGGLLPLTWSETGALPPGMVLGTDGALSGMPTATGSFPISVEVQDALHQNAPAQDFTIQIDAKLPVFTATGDMQTARAGHTATVLNSGKVIVIGGLGGLGGYNGALGSAELFDPTGGHFNTLTGHLMTPRSFHTATLLKSGKVLVTGGIDVNGNAIADAELFDPSTGSFATTGAMNSARRGHTATLLNDGRVLVAGGIATGTESNQAVLSTAELFDPATGKFTLANGPMNASRAYHAATLLSSGKVLLAGGSADTALGDIFDPTSNTFISTTNGGTEAAGLTATLLVDGRVLLAGGEVVFSFTNCHQLEGTHSVASASLFDATAASFSASTYMSSYRSQHTATVLPDSKVLIAGGANIQTFEDQCVRKGTTSVLSSAELFDPTHGSFALTSSMATARSTHTATLLANGDVLVIGGVDANNNLLASAELYH